MLSLVRPSVGFRPSFNPINPLLLHPQFKDILPPNLASSAIVQHVASAQQIQQAAQGVKPSQPSIEDLLDIERELALNPMGVLQRHFRVYLLPGTIAGGVLTFAPQRRCVPFRVVVAEGTAGTITQLQAGVEQYFATGAAVSVELFSELSADAPWLRPIIVEVGQTITAQTTIANGTAVAILCFDLSDKGLLAAPTGRPMFCGFTQAIPATGNATITIRPQKPFRIRRMVLDPNQPNFASLTVTQLLVANQPQTEASGSLPANVFSAKGIALNMDGDLCAVGAEIDVTIANANAAAVNAFGGFWGDTLDQ